MAFARLWKLVGFIAVAALPAGSNLLLTLVLVRGLGVEGFATWSIVEPLLLIFATLAALGMQYGVLFTSASDAADPRRALGTGILVALPTAIVLSVIVWFAIGLTIEPIGLVNIVVPLVSDTIAVLIIASLRGQRRMPIWLGFEAIRSLGLVLVAFGALRFEASWVANVDNFLMLRGCITATAVVVTAILLKAQLRFDGALALRMVKYGLPISAAALAALVTNSADRFLLASFQIDRTIIASYAAHQRLIGILMVLTVTPLNLWFAVEAMRRDTEKQASFFQGTLIALLAALSLLILATFIVSPMLWPYLFPQLPFQPMIFALLGLAIVPQALGIVLNIGGLREKKTYLNAIVVAATGATVLALGIPLVHLATGGGAATARLGAFVVSALTGRRISQSVAPVRHRVLPLLPFLAAIACATATLFSQSGGIPEWLPAVTSLALVALGLVANRKVVRAVAGNA